MTDVLDRIGPRRLTRAALALSAVVLAAAAVHAARVRGAPAVATADTVQAMPSVPEPARTNADSLVIAAVARHPFRADRRRPANRYRLPGEAVQTPPSSTARTRRRRVPRIELLGVAAGPDGGGLAVLKLRGRPAQVVSIDRTIDDYRLARVEPDNVRLVGPDTTIVLRLRSQEESAHE